MSNILWKNIHLCLPKFKCLPTTTPLSPPSHEDHQEESVNLLQINAPNNSNNMIKNFNSIYDITSSTTSSTSKSLTYSSTDFSSDIDSDDVHDLNDSPTPDFSTIFASQRFFFSSPGKSNSIIDSPETRKNDDANDDVVSGSIAIQTYSPDPYADFRKSMQEMVEARELSDVEANWEYLHELLLCYLSLNPKHTHKVIIGAFTDLIVSLMMSLPPTNGHRKKDVDQYRCTTSRLLV
ncbi:hypothetical protein M9H77_35170 [Catharanthus roseus]|uniref:Uncharacterized protein n=1 Tax=Catharanthus roseus TaxID=4058 RepID=A0ACB9ZRX9_CATRO|nr:hypothetical protein M9H77_35170 [Catharanthus roseus]